MTERLRPPHACHPIHCLISLRQHVRECLEASALIPTAPLMGAVCYTIAKLAVDPDGIALRTEQAAHWDIVEDVAAVTAEQFGWEIQALRDHLVQSGDMGGMGRVPAVVMTHFVCWDGSPAQEET